ncbi:Mth938-like domain-containing protein [Acidihalobacter prosperus]|uniref:Xcc1710-like domain-containing protein n=1 Tax=Acidihalobacter prosperus TaxID=160660 RepID=A0A1A6C807_9GAMM|nr:Mth938-like domain-containing protein [Acidihalobacter prosperus]OBS10702.1 hypothetical protein Thpro_020418 [Acidihalobacter prosperus]
MRFIEDSADASYIIDAHGPGWVSINHVAYSDSLIVMPEWLLVPWRPARFDDFEVDDLASVLDKRPEILLVGTGERQRFPDGTCLARLANIGAGCEFMSTAAACRTYTILMAEKRRVAAALLQSD